MHDIEPFQNWQKFYRAEKDIRSPFHGRNYETGYVNEVYGYYIDPLWDEFGSETLYCKILYTDYVKRASILEFIGEWNDTLHNDIMHLKRNVLDVLLRAGIQKFLLITENIFQFHGSETDYYEEWLEDVEEGWISLINARQHITEEMKKYRLDYYLNFGGTLEIPNWRTAKPTQLVELIDALMARRLGM